MVIRRKTTASQSRTSLAKSGRADHKVDGKAEKGARRSGTVRRNAKAAAPTAIAARNSQRVVADDEEEDVVVSTPRAQSTPPTPPPAPIVRSGARPVVVARGDDSSRVFSETLKHSGFFDAIESAQIKSGKKREVYEVVCKVDFMRGVRQENEPVSYVDPRLVANLFNQLLDHGFRILRVVEVRGELSRYLAHRSVKEVGKALGYDESCYELKDLGDDLVPVDLGPSVGRRATGRIWKQSDFRIVFAKNRTDECFGPALALWNVWHTLATPTDLVAMEYGVDPGDFALAMLERLPVHFALIDAIHSRDGSPGNVFPYELLRAADGSGPEAAQVHRLGTVLAGADVLAVEAAGHKMQGLDPVTDPLCLQKLRKTTGWKPPAEVDALPVFPGWKGIGARVRELLAAEKPAESTRLSLSASLTQVDSRLFPPQASAWQAIRMRQKVEAMIDELRRRRGAAVGAPAAAPESIDAADVGEDEDDPAPF